MRSIQHLDVAMHIGKTWLIVNTELYVQSLPFLCQLLFIYRLDTNVFVVLQVLVSRKLLLKETVL